MTDDEKRIALAEFAQWKYVNQSALMPSRPWWLEPPYQWERYSESFQAANVVSEQPHNWSGDIHGALPDWPGDLNAMRDLIMSLPVEGEVSQKAMRFWMWKVAGQMAVLPSAREYADGFLMMIGKLKP